MARTRRRPLIAAALVLGALASAGFAHAASLSITGAQLGTFTASHPCPQARLAATTDPTTASASTVTVTVPVDLPPACAEKALALAVTNGATAVYGAATTPASGSVTVAVGPFTPTPTTPVVATVNGWSVPVDWSYDPLPVPSDVIISGTGKTTVTLGPWTQSGSLTCVAATVSSDAGNHQWRVDIDTTKPPFSGATPTFSGLPDGALVWGPVVGNPGWTAVWGAGAYERILHKDAPITFTICG